MRKIAWVFPLVMASTCTFNGITGPKSYVFYDLDIHREIMRIDSDGDIFLRGKWIGWDGRLKLFFKKAKP